MRLKRTHCANCGSMLDLQVEESQSRVFCPYCGQVYEIDYHRKEIVVTQNINVTERYSNEADVIRAKTKDRESRHWWVYILVLVGFLVVEFACIMLVPRINESIAQSEGKIRAGYYYDYRELPYQAAEMYLRELGFTNIVLIDLEDAEYREKRDGEVESITVNGDSKFSDDDFFYPTDKVIIRYH